MARPIPHLSPKALQLLTDLGTRISLARERRGLTRRLTAKRAGITEFTLRRVEAGEVGVTIGAYLAALHALGLEGDLAQVAAADPIGRDLQDAPLLARQQRHRLRQPAEVRGGSQPSTEPSDRAIPRPAPHGPELTIADILAHLPPPGDAT